MRGEMATYRYHNAGIMVFCVVSTHFLTLFGAGWGWMIVILAVCATYYQSSVRRVRRNARDDMAREVAKKGLKSDVESATWINLFRKYSYPSSMNSRADDLHSV